MCAYKENKMNNKAAFRSQLSLLLILLIFSTIIDNTRCITWHLELEQIEDVGANIEQDTQNENDQSQKILSNSDVQEDMQIDRNEEEDQITKQYSPFTEFQVQLQDNPLPQTQQQLDEQIFFPELEIKQGYLQQIQVGSKWDKSQNDICYDRFVDKYRNSDIRWKDPQIMFYKAGVLQENVKRIKKHNSQPGITYILGVNQYADMTLQQFRNRYLSNQPTDPVTSVKAHDVIKSDILVSNSFAIDWQCFDSPPLNQGECDAGYAFSVLSSIQTTMRIHGLSISPLSVQEIISCGSEANKMEIRGCNGGYIKSVYEYVANKGVGQMAMYDVQQQVTKTGKTSRCQSKTLKNKKYLNKKTFIQSYQQIPKGDCSEVVYRLRFRALAVSVDSSQFPFYKEGVISMRNNDNIQIDHGVTLVGYDPDSQNFKIKNSWGPKWGLKGYAFVDKNVGICQEAYYPILKNEKTLPSFC